MGELGANPFGLCDMHGNVWEWCQDWYDTHTYAQRSVDLSEDPSGPATGTARVLRGGNWKHYSTVCGSAFRLESVASYRSEYYGFRVVVSTTRGRR